MLMLNALDRDHRKQVEQLPPYSLLKITSLSTTQFPIDMIDMNTGKPLSEFGMSLFQKNSKYLRPTGRPVLRSIHSDEPDGIGDFPIGHCILSLLMLTLEV